MDYNGIAGCHWHTIGCVQTAPRGLFLRTNP
jgi:hypothetical protein